MAYNSDVSSTFSSRDYYCKVCNIYLDTIDSLDVHLRYHKENIHMKWKRFQNDIDNDKIEKVNNETIVTAPADSSDSIITKPSPEFQQRATPETSVQFLYDTTRQSYDSAPSPYQNQDLTNFSQGLQSHSGFSQNQHYEQINWEQTKYDQEYQECHKCGFVCDSAVQLINHTISAHSVANVIPSTASLPYQQYNSKVFNKSNHQSENTKINEESKESSDILDLDSHKLLNQGYEGEQALTLNMQRAPIMSSETYNLYNNLQLHSKDALFKDQKIFSEQTLYPSKAEMVQSEQNMLFTQGKLLGVHYDQKKNMYIEQKINPGAQIPSLADYSGPVESSNLDLKPQYRSYDSPLGLQITSTQPANPTSSILPLIGRKGAKWKSNEARRSKTYNCTACNKWFTSSGHLKRHYNTTLHKNAVRCSGQPDPATLPISNYHHPSHDMQNQVQQYSEESNTHGSAPSEDSRSIDESTLQSPYASHNFGGAHRVADIQSETQYTHLQRGNLDNNFSIKSLANHPLQHELGSNPLRIGSPSHVTGNPNDSNYRPPKSDNFFTLENPPSGVAGPSYISRAQRSVSTSDITTPILTQSPPALTMSTLPPISHLGINPYSPRSTYPSIQNPSYTPLHLDQNFHQTLVPNYPNGLGPHVMDMAINNRPLANPTTFGEEVLEEVEAMEPETLRQPGGGVLPSVSQLQTQSLDVSVSKYITQPNVGGQVNSTAGYLILHESESGQLQLLDCRLEDFENKENHTIQINPPASPEGGTADKNSNSSHTVSSTMPTTPLTEKKQIKKAASMTMHKCYECDKQFNKACYLTQHNKTMHSGVKPFKCTRCGKRFSDDASYEWHCFKHSDNKPFKCSECPKSFNHKSDLRRHMCLHSDCMPFTCNHCGKGFIRKDHMVKHCATHKRKQHCSTSPTLSMVSSSSHAIDIV